MVANCLSLVKNKKVTFLVANLDTVAIELTEGIEIASVNPFVQGHQPSANVNAILGIGETAEVVQVGDQLSQSQLMDLSNLLAEFKNAFAIGGKIGRTTIAEHKIELMPDAKPFAEPIRRHPRLHEAEARR